MNDVRDILGKLGTVLDGIETIESIAKHVLGDEAKDAFEALHLIAVVIDTVKAGLKGKMTIKEVQTEINNLHKTVLDNDTAADATLHARFNKDPA